MLKQGLVILFLGVLILGCSTSTTSSTTGATSLAALPKATGTTTATASISRRAGELQSATTGTQLDAWYTAFNGQTSKSQTFCQLGLLTKEVVKAASSPDKIACYMGVMEKYASLSNWPSTAGDGNYHYVNLTGTGGGDGKIKFKINKTGDVITGFEMFSGFGGAVQTEYVSMSTSGGNINLTSVQFYNGDGGNMVHRGRVTVTGTINSSGTWTSAKTMVAETTRSESGSWTRSENARMDVVQYSDRFQVQGYRTGSENYGSAATYTDQAYALVQLLTPNPLSTMALGEGTAKVSMTHSGYSPTPFSQTRAWNGDTGAPISPATTADYYSTVSAATLPSAPSAYNTTFAAAETWDLTTPTGETAVTSNLTTLQSDASAAAEFTACDTTYGFNEESNWPNCWSASDN